MFTLKVLGGAALEGPEGPVTGRPAQKRRLALLALLAMSRTHRLSREKLIGFLWPDRDEDSARHLLSDAVYVLNRALGADTLAGTGDELRLNAGRIACDARAFERAAPADPEAAARLYTGGFLDGFFLDGSEEFEAWATRERERLAGLFAAVLERIAQAREAEGDYRAAVDAWRRLAVEDPYNSGVAVHLARALERSGDRAGALQAAQAHAAFLRKELGLHPTAELRERIASLQAASDVEETPGSAARADTSMAAGPPDVMPAPPAAEAIPIQTGPADPPPRWPGRRASLLWGLLTTALVLVALFWLLPWRAVDSATPLRSIAVMPFEDMGANGQYLGAGLADELTTQLGRETGLKVAARTSAFAIRDRQLDAREIGRALGVEALLEGSVRREDPRVRVAVRLVSTRDGYQVWSETWDRPLDEMPAIQEQIARAVLQVLGGEAPRRDGAAARADIPAEAYHLYLQGRYLWHQRTAVSLRQAAEAFERATAIAPEYPQAFSGLADAYAVMGFYDYLPPGEAFPRAKAAAGRALALDPQLSQAHASLGYVALYYDWRWAEAEAAFERAIALNPSYSVGHQWYANYLTARGRYPEAVAAMRRAQEVDPLSLIASAALGWVHFFGRDYDAAAEQCRRTLELNPRFELAHLWAGWAEEAAGRYEPALEHLEAAVRLSADGAVALASLGRAQALAGDERAARDTLAMLRRLHAGYLPAFELAKLHLALNERGEAIAWLRRAYAERSHSMVFLDVDPQLDALREDPRFREIQSQIGPGGGQ